MSQPEYQFEIAISFAGDNKRELVRKMAELLQEKVGKGKVFFDEWFEAEIAGPEAHIRRRRHNPRAEPLGELQREQRDAAGPLRDDDRARPDRALLDHRRPCGQRARPGSRASGKRGCASTRFAPPDGGDACAAIFMAAAFRTPAPDQACPSRRGPASETLPMSTDARFQKHHKQSDLPKSRRTPRLSTLPNQHVPARSPFGTTLPLHAPDGNCAWHSEPGNCRLPRGEPCLVVARESMDATQVRHLLALAAIYDGQRVPRRPRSAP